VAAEVVAEAEDGLARRATDWPVALLARVPRAAAEAAAAAAGAAAVAAEDARVLAEARALAVARALAAGGAGAGLHERDPVAGSKVERRRQAAGAGQKAGLLPRRALAATIGLDAHGLGGLLRREVCLEFRWVAQQLRAAPREAQLGFVHAQARRVVQDLRRTRRGGWSACGRVEKGQCRRSCDGESTRGTHAHRLKRHEGRLAARLRHEEHGRARRRLGRGLGCGSGRVLGEGG